MKLTATEAFLLRVFVEKLTPEQRGKLENSPFKSLTWQRLFSKELKNLNTAFEDKMEKLDELVVLAQKEINDFVVDIGFEDAEDKAPKQKEIDTFTEKVNTEFTTKAKELGEMYFVSHEGMQYFFLKDETEVSVSLDETHTKYLKEKLEEFGTIIPDEDVWISLMGKV